MCALAFRIHPFIADTYKPLYNIFHYNTILDTTSFKYGSQKRIA